VTARGLAGTLMTEEIRVQLRAQNVLSRPTSDDTVDVDRVLVLRSKIIRSADQYCWTITQDSYSSGNLCNTSPRLEVGSDFLHDAGIDDGSMKIVAKAYRGTIMIGRQGVTVAVVHDD
jgi:hypothetical protein